MKRKFAYVSLVATIFLGALHVEARDQPAKPALSPEQRFLKQLVGEWESDSESVVEPGKAPEKAKGKESVRAVGDHWVIAENRPAENSPHLGISTIGYDATKKKIVATFISSASGDLILYEGSLDAEGRVLTLHTELPNPAQGGKLSKFKDEIELKDKDNKIMKSSALTDGGTWFTFQTFRFRRKK